MASRLQAELLRDPRLAEALDAVAALDPDHLSWAEQEELVHGTEGAQRRLDAVRLRALEGFARGGGWQDAHHTSAAGWVRAELGRSRADAGRDLSMGRALRDWPAVGDAPPATTGPRRNAGTTGSAG